MERKVKTKVQGFRTVDGAGVNLVRVLGHRNTKEFDPILMLDSFDSVNPDEYTAGFPLHPHRGIETISYLYKGKMVHKDTLGNEDAIGDGQIQWMNSGSGILHEEQVPASDRLLGVQLWLNLPKKNKMSSPTYHNIGNDQIYEIEFDGGYLRLLAGEYGEYKGHQGEHLPLNYYDIHLNEGTEFNIEMKEDDSVMVFTLLGGAVVAGEEISEKTAVKLTNGTSLTLKGKDGGSQILYIQSRALNEPIAWAGPIVMNSRAELEEAFGELENGTFFKEKLDIE
ncbi:MULTISPECIES: pirin family protein [Helcococcus]|uniref:Pirin family protein n=1 Tax=Helcococcus bovis TaxID=3153252 RepID=A0ABW9F7T0_9FIRM